MATDIARGPDPLAVRRRVLTRAVFSVVAWLATFFFVFPVAAELAAITRLLLFALIVVAPLPLALVAATEKDARAAQLLRLAQKVYLPAAVLAVASILLVTGVIAASFAVPWLVFAALIALAGLARLRAHRLSQLEELSIDAGLLYLPVGGVWLLLSRLGANPLNFGDTIVLLTAVHFHFAGYAAPVIAGLAGRSLRELAPVALPLFGLVALGIIAGMALVAAGITATAALGVLLPEALAVGVLALSLLGFSVLALVYVLPAAEQLGTRALMLVSGLSPIVTMLVALAYAAGRFTGAWSISIPQMVEWHGWINALGFIFCGLLAWLLSPSTLNN